MVIHGDQQKFHKLCVCLVSHSFFSAQVSIACDNEAATLSQRDGTQSRYKQDHTLRAGVPTPTLVKVQLTKAIIWFYCLLLTRATPSLHPTKAHYESIRLKTVGSLE